MAKQKEAWDKLSMQEKAQLIKLSIDNGVSSLKQIRDTYNLYSNGGQEEVLNKVNSSNANFVQRLKDPNRKSIPDWESPTDRISTHKLSVATDENGNHYIFPEVQEINGELIDFTRPPYHRFAGEISAEMRGDTVRVPSIEDAIKFTETYKQYYPFNSGGNLVHKKSGEEQGESQELNTKTYKEKKESSAYPMYYNVLSQSLGDTSLSGAILRALIHKNAEDPNIYTGSYYFGDKWGFGTSQELPQNRNLISLYLDGDTTGFKQFNGRPIVLDGDTLTQTQYEGTLLPQDTIYLRPESKATIARMAKDKDLLKINNSFPGWISYSSKYNFLDSPYFLDKYEGKVMDDANNLNISFKQNSDGSYYADVFDLWDLTGTGGYKAGAILEKKLAEDSIENNGPFILRQHIPIVFNRDSVSDGRFLDAISVGQWQKEIDDTNQKSTGGPLYPFSFEKNPFLKTPIVRY